MIVHLHRLNKGDLSFQTPAELRVFSPDYCQLRETFVTLEPPWDGNKTDVSCLPNGEYELVKRWSKQYGHHFHVVDTYGRSMVLIHIGNFRKNTKGCILPGKQFVDIDGDGHKDVTSSGDVMKVLNEILPFRCRLLITSEFNLATHV